MLKPETQRGDQSMSVQSDVRAKRLLHTMLRVHDLDASLAFYTDLLGMRLLRKDDFPGGRFTLAFVGYDEEGDGAVIELTHNWDQDKPYALGDGYGHLALATDDAAALVEKLRAGGATITREAGPMKHGTRVIAFLEDPDGYKIELVERD